MILGVSNTSALRGDSACEDVCPRSLCSDACSGMLLLCACIFPRCSGGNIRGTEGGELSRVIAAGVDGEALVPETSLGIDTLGCGGSTVPRGPLGGRWCNAVQPWPAQ